MPRRQLPCIHFTGIQHDTCKAGVNYRALTGGGDGYALRLPCITLVGEKPVEKVTCDKQRAETKEESEVREAAADAAVERVLKVLPVIADLKRGLPKGKGSIETIKCPICSGTMQVRIASSNHHAAAKCETENCVSFIE